jgi:hypothetical protein
VPPLTPLTQETDCEPAVEASIGKTRLAAVETLTCHHVALIGRVDDLLEWIRDATALQFFHPGGSVSLDSTAQGAIHISPSVELVERSAASRLLGKLNGQDEVTAVPWVPVQQDGNSERP